MVDDLRRSEYGQPLSKLSQIRKKVVVYGEREANAYLAAIFPRSFAMVTRVLSEIKLSNDAFTPNSILDFGCGPSTALWYDIILPIIIATDFNHEISSWLYLGQRTIYGRMRGRSIMELIYRMTWCLRQRNYYLKYPKRKRIA